MRPQGGERGRRRGAGSGAAPRGEAETLRWCRDAVTRVNELGPQMGALADDDFRGLTARFRDRACGGEPLDDLLPEAFATVREAAARTLGQRHFDVQVMGGVVLHLGKVAEMRTGEGKTLTATLPAYLHALAGTGVHMMTANDHLANRDEEWMRPVYEFLGLESGLLRPTETGATTRRAAYGAAVTYGTAEQFAYDFLRDNLALTRDGTVQRGQRSAVVDEADLILVDNMRSTPSVAGPSESDGRWHVVLAKVAARLRPGEDYAADARTRTVSLTERGSQAAEDQLGIGNLYDGANLPLAGYLLSALKAKEHYQRNRDYLVADGRIVVIDQVSGRPLRERTFGEGIDEAIAAKEGLKPRGERRLLATVTMWDYLGRYERLAAMTGTAREDAETYREAYRLDVVTIPTNKPMIRVDHPDVLYATEESKLAALAAETATRHAAGQPVLIGAISIEEAQAVSAVLADRGIRHELLTAINHEQEARVIAGAGQEGAVTVAARMAGRGTDIVLGGADGAGRERVADLGGLCVLGTERPSLRRLEMHIRGRAGRQGDPGEAKFFISRDGDMARAVLSGTPAFIRRLIMADGTAIPALSRALTSVQAGTAAREAASLAAGRQWDQVLARQLRLLDAERAPAARGEVIRDQILGYVAQAEDPERGFTVAAYLKREAELGPDLMRPIECQVTCAVLNRHWSQYLQAAPALLAASSLRGQGTEALAQYSRDAARMFDAMISEAHQEIVHHLFTLEVEREGPG